MANQHPDSRPTKSLPWRRITERLLLTLVALALLTYLADWAVFLLRGKPQRQVTVDRYLSVPLKNNKTEFDLEGTQPIPCAIAIFPQGSLTPCWYLEKHTSQADKL